jgi:hypothetical protein
MQRSPYQSASLKGSIASIEFRVLAQALSWPWPLYYVISASLTSDWETGSIEAFVAYERCRVTKALCKNFCTCALNFHSETSLQDAEHDPDTQPQRSVLLFKDCQSVSALNRCERSIPTKSVKHEWRGSLRSWSRPPVIILSDRLSAASVDFDYNAKLRI